MKKNLHRVALASTVLVLAACTPPAATPLTASTGGASPQANPQASQAPAQAPGIAVIAARPVKDPTGTEQIKVREYWDFDKHSVMEVDNYVATFGSDRDQDGKQETRLTAQVSLPTKKTLALLQVSEDADTGEEDEASEDPADGDDEAELAEGGDEVAAAEEELEEEELDEYGEDILDVDADGDWDEDDDGYTDAYEDEADDDASEEYTEAEEAALLAGPHEIVMELENEPAMSGGVDTVWVSDLTADEDIAISCDQDWTYFELSTEDDSLRVEFNPDGSFTIDGEPAADQRAAVALLQESPMVQGTSRHALAFIAARLGRLPSESSRMVMPRSREPIQKGSGFGRMRILAADAPTAQRAYALTNALVEALVKAGE